MAMVASAIAVPSIFSGAPPSVRTPVCAGGSAEVSARLGEPKGTINIYIDTSIVIYYFIESFAVYVKSCHLTLVPNHVPNIFIITITIIK